MNSFIVVSSIVAALFIVYYYLEKANKEKNDIENFREKLKETFRK